MNKKENIISNYQELQKENYICVFKTPKNYFPKDLGFVNIPYKEGLLLNKEISFKGKDYEEKSIWINLKDKNIFYTGIFRGLLKQIHQENADLIYQILDILDELDYSYIDQEAIYLYRFYEIVKDELKFNLLIKDDFKTFSCWNKERTMKFNFDNWKEEFKEFLNESKIIS